MVCQVQSNSCGREPSQLRSAAPPSGEGFRPVEQRPSPSQALTRQLSRRESLFCTFRAVEQRPRPLRHGLRRATSPKGRGKKRSRHALGSPLGRAAERSEAERAWPLKTARAQNLSQKRFRFVEISSPSRAVEQRLPLRGQLSPQVTERVPRTTKTPHTVVAHCVRGSDSAFRQISRYQLLWCTPQISVKTDYSFRTPSLTPSAASFRPTSPLPRA